MPTNLSTNLTTPFSQHKLDEGSEAAENAYELERFDMESIHEGKTSADSEDLRKKREDLEAFKDAENQEVPAAERWVEFICCVMLLCVLVG